VFVLVTRAHDANGWGITVLVNYLYILCLRTIAMHDIYESFQEAVATWVIRDRAGDGGKGGREER
jgi:hypothetical protein